MSKRGCLSIFRRVDDVMHSAINSKGIWPRRAPREPFMRPGVWWPFFLLFKKKFSRGSCLGCLNAIYGPVQGGGGVLVNVLSPPPSGNPVSALGLYPFFLGGGGGTLAIPAGYTGLDMSWISSWLPFTWLSVCSISSP